jgi:hypothetical protein
MIDGRIVIVLEKNLRNVTGKSQIASIEEIKSREII